MKASLIQPALFNIQGSTVCGLIIRVMFCSFQNELLFTDIIQLSVEGAVSEGQEDMTIADIGDHQPSITSYSMYN